MAQQWGSFLGQWYKTWCKLSCGSHFVGKFVHGRGFSKVERRSFCENYSSCLIVEIGGLYLSSLTWYHILQIISTWMQNHNSRNPVTPLVHTRKQAGTKSSRVAKVLKALTQITRGCTKLTYNRTNTDHHYTFLLSWLSRISKRIVSIEEFWIPWLFSRFPIGRKMNCCRMLRDKRGIR